MEWRNSASIADIKVTDNVLQRKIEALLIFDWTELWSEWDSTKKKEFMVILSFIYWKKKEKWYYLPKN